MAYKVIFTMILRRKKYLNVVLHLAFSVKTSMATFFVNLPHMIMLLINLPWNCDILYLLFRNSMAECEEKATPTEHATPLFKDINADDETPEIMEIESLCVQCEEQVCFYLSNKHVTL